MPRQSRKKTEKQPVFLTLGQAIRILRRETGNSIDWCENEARARIKLYDVDGETRERVLDSYIHGLVGTHVLQKSISKNASAQKSLRCIGRLVAKAYGFTVDEISIKPAIAPTGVFRLEGAIQFGGPRC
jgi:hypothetical protein